jgi:hypothetical protein
LIRLTFNAEVAERINAEEKKSSVPAREFFAGFAFILPNIMQKRRSSIILADPLTASWLIRV